MTLKELSGLYCIKKEIKHNKERLQQLRETHVKASKLKDMPNLNCVIYDAIGEKVATIIELEEILRKSVEKRYEEELKLTKYIESIDDCLIRLIFKLRFLECKTWRQVAREVGGGNTDLTVRNRCYRFLKGK